MCRGHNGVPVLLVSLVSAALALTVPVRATHTEWVVPGEAPTAGAAGLTVHGTDPLGAVWTGGLAVDVQDAGTEAAYVGIVELSADGAALATIPDLGLLDGRPSPSSARTASGSRTASTSTSRPSAKVMRRPGSSVTSERGRPATANMRRSERSETDEGAVLEIDEGLVGEPQDHEGAHRNTLSAAAFEPPHGTPRLTGPPEARSASRPARRSDRHPEGRSSSLPTR